MGAGLLPSTQGESDHTRAAQARIIVTSSRSSSGETENSDGMQVDIYRYKYMAFAFDYRSSVNRVALVLATKDPLYGSAMLFDQIAGVDIKTAFASCGGVEITAHFNARSNVCPGSHAENYIAKIFLYQAVLTVQMRKEANLDVCKAAETPDPNKCPGFASVPALAVALIKASATSDEKLTRVADAFLSEWDFNGGIDVLSPSEADAFSKLQDQEGSMSSRQLAARQNQQVIDRRSRYLVLLHH